MQSIKAALGLFAAVCASSIAWVYILMSFHQENSRERAVSAASQELGGLADASLAEGLALDAENTEGLSAAALSTARSMAVSEEGSLFNNAHLSTLGFLSVPATLDTLYAQKIAMASRQLVSRRRGRGLCMRWVRLSLSKALLEGASSEPESPG